MPAASPTAPAPELPRDTAPDTWADWLRDPARVAWLKTHPDAWAAALPAAAAFLTYCIRRAGVLALPGTDFEDWHATAVAALYEGVQRYDAARGTAPTTFLVPWVVGRLRNAARTAHPGGLHYRRRSPGPRAAVVSLTPLADGPPADTHPALLVPDPSADGLLRAEWHRWLAACAPADRRLLVLLAAGHTQRAAARVLGVTPTAISHRVRVLAAAWQAGLPPPAGPLRGRPARRGARQAAPAARSRPVRA